MDDDGPTRALKPSSSFAWACGGWMDDGCGEVRGCVGGGGGQEERGDRPPDTQHKHTCGITTKPRPRASPLSSSHPIHHPQTRQRVFLAPTLATPNHTERPRVREAQEGQRPQCHLSSPPTPPTLPHPNPSITTPTTTCPSSSFPCPRASPQSPSPSPNMPSSNLPPA